MQVKKSYPAAISPPKDQCTLNSMMSHKKVYTILLWQFKLIDNDFVMWKRLCATYTVQQFIALDLTLVRKVIFNLIVGCDQFEWFSALPVVSAHVYWPVWNCLTSVVVQELRERRATTRSAIRRSLGICVTPAVYRSHRTQTAMDPGLSL